jgi:hypothetical protein
MTKKVYRTAQGKLVDLGRLQLQNENTRAVGNMNVNARGDRLDSNNQSIDTKAQQVSRQYNRQTTNVNSDTVSSSKNNIRQAPEAHSVADPAMTVQEPIQQEIMPVIDEKSGGLAAAIARARQIKQEPVKTSKQLAQEQAGVRKI